MSRLAFVVLCVLAAPALAQSSWPDRVLLHFGDDPATSLKVTWRTQRRVDRSVGQIAIATDGPEIRETRAATLGEARMLKVEPPAVIPDNPYDRRLQVRPHDSVAMHEVAFTGLTPGTLYAYRVGDGEHWSEWFHARTADAVVGPGDVAPFRFVYVGDAQNDIKSLWSRVMRQAYADATDALFLLHAGDLVDHANEDREWAEWFHGGGFVFGQIPCVAIPGNHEYARRAARNTTEEMLQKVGIWQGTLSDRWDERFAFPKNGPEGLEETAYFFDVNGVRVIGLNSMAALQSQEDRDKQTAWLREVLSENPCRWTIVTHHHPIHSSSRGRDNLTLREDWQPVYDEFGVDLVLQGHDHSYGRSGLLVGEDHDHGDEHGHAHPHADHAAGDGSDAQGGPADTNVATGVTGTSPGGTVYVVSVSGPKQYPVKEYPEGENPFVARGENLQLYQIIDVSAEEIVYEARTATGRLHDRFVLAKDAAGKKSITHD